MLILFENVKYDSKHFKKSISSDPSEDTLFTLGKGEYSFKNICFVYTIGKQNIINDKFVLDYGLRFGWTPAANVVTIFSGEDFVNTTEQYFRHAVNMRIFRQQIFNFHLGIGFLAF